MGTEEKIKASAAHGEMSMDAGDEDFNKAAQRLNNIVWDTVPYPEMHGEQLRLLKENPDKTEYLLQQFEFIKNRAMMRIESHPDIALSDYQAKISEWAKADMERLNTSLEIIRQPVEKYNQSNSVPDRGI